MRHINIFPGLLKGGVQKVYAEKVDVLFVNCPSIIPLILDSYGEMLSACLFLRMVWNFTLEWPWSHPWKSPNVAISVATGIWHLCRWPQRLATQTILYCTKQSPPPRAKGITILSKMIACVQLLFWSYSGDYSYSYQGYSNYFLNYRYIFLVLLARVQLQEIIVRRNFQ